MRPDVIIVGGGIVGVAIAHQLLVARPDLRLELLEKEPALARHQTGHNSGVLHSGVYYRPGSLKATTCRAGKLAMEAFCEAEGLPWKRCGKVIVATTVDEAARLPAILERGRANGVDCRLIGPSELAELEPHAAGVAALHVPEAGVVDFAAVTRRLAALVVERGGVIRTSHPVVDVRRLDARLVISAAGLDAARLARARDVAIVPFLGRFLALRPSAAHLCRALIYPVPDPTLPFLGVHLTRTIGDTVKAGPNALLLAPPLFAGVPRMAWRHRRAALAELTLALSRRAFAAAAARLVPALQPDDFEPGPGPSGIRAQAVARDGTLVEDFLIAEGDAPPALHVLNAPSPAATAALEIGRVVAARALARF